ncbi:MAG: hypothetical protein GDA43_10010 [Hormoscilla sp. SP5CHS1]|nr:hypothetical protein [Hormoscilla sp. SP5CHS1]
MSSQRPISDSCRPAQPGPNVVQWQLAAGTQAQTKKNFCRHYQSNQSILGVADFYPIAHRAG